MTSTNEHIIKSQKFEIVIEDPKRGHEIQSAISVLQNASLEKQIHKVLNKFSQEGKVFQFNSIELDVGTIANWNFEEELVFRIEESLINFLDTQILASGGLKSGKEIVLKNKEIDQLEHFLKWGYFLWNSAPNQSAKRLIHQLLEKNQEGLVQLFNRLGKKSIVRKRMAFQLGEETLDNIVFAVAKKDGEQIITYKNSIIAQQQKEKFVDDANANFKSAVWEVVLSYLFVETNGYYHKKNFLKYLITKTAHKYSMSYDDLLSLMVKGVKSQKGASKKDEFASIILELDQSKKGKTENATYPKTEEEAFVVQFKELLEQNQYSEDLPSRQHFQKGIKEVLKGDAELIENTLLLHIKSDADIAKIMALVDVDILSEILKRASNGQLHKMLRFYEVLATRSFKKPYEEVTYFFKQWANKNEVALKAFLWTKNRGESEFLAVLKSVSSILGHRVHFVEFLKAVAPQLSAGYQQSIAQFLSLSAVGVTPVKSEGKDEVMALKKGTIERHNETKRQLVAYVLQHGRLPWWLTAYTREKFKSDFLFLWEDAAYRNNLRKVLREKNSLQFLANFLRDKDLVVIYGMTASKSIFTFFRTFIQLFQKQKFAVKNDLQIDFNQFRKESLKWVLVNNGASDTVFLDVFAKQWAKSLHEFGSNDENDSIVASFTGVKQKNNNTKVKATIDRICTLFTTTTSAKKVELGAKKIFIGYMRADSMAEIEKKSELTILKHLIFNEPEQFKGLLQNTEANGLLLSELESSGNISWLKELMHANNRSYFDEVLAQINKMALFISHRQYTDFYKSFYLLLFKHIPTADFKCWKAEEWGNLFLEAVHKALHTDLWYEVLQKVQCSFGKRKALKQHKTVFGHILSEGNSIGPQVQKKKPLPQKSTAKESQDYKKLGEKEDYQFKNPIYINNAGLVILSPYLGMLFERCMLMEKGIFKDEACQYRAVQLLEFAVNGKMGTEEHELALNKVLCGLPVVSPIPLHQTIADSDKEVVNGMLKAVTQQWKALSNTSIEGFQSAFLRRKAKLGHGEEQFYLSVEQQSYDMLLDQIPWSIGKIKLSWMEKLLEVAWR
ncbi:MAG: contractile injection system tape measure protein [Bacteroidota bacterium]